MKKIFYFIFIFFIVTNNLIAKIIIFKDCKSKDHSFIKNEYKIDIDKGIMVRNFIYDEKSFQKLKMNDISIKKINKREKRILEKNEIIYTEISGYPTFYTQMIFEKKKSEIRLKSVLNNIEGVSLISKCSAITEYKKES